MKKQLPILLLGAALIPSIASAQTVQNFLVNILSFIGTVVVPFLFGLAFLFFIINVVRYFVIGAHNEEAQESAKSLAIYGVGAFVFLVIFWGLINLLIGSTGLAGCSQPASDYANPGATNPCSPSTATTPANSTADNDEGYQLPLNLQASDNESPAATTDTNVDCSAVNPEDPTYSGCLEEGNQTQTAPESFEVTPTDNDANYQLPLEYQTQ